MSRDWNYAIARKIIATERANTRRYERHKITHNGSPHARYVLTLLEHIKDHPTNTTLLNRFDSAWSQLTPKEIAWIRKQNHT